MVSRFIQRHCPNSQILGIRRLLIYILHINGQLLMFTTLQAFAAKNADTLFLESRINRSVLLEVTQVS